MTALLFVSIFILTAAINWAIPLAIYTSKFGLFKKRPKNFIGCNFWGIVMDVIIAGLINAIVFNYLYSLSPNINVEDLLAALSGGLTFSVVLHIFMATTYWKEWIMPKPWRWNLGGYWHMFSMTVQMAFLFCPLVLIKNEPQLLGLLSTRVMLFLASLLGVLFLCALSLKNTDLKIGPVKISAKPW